MVYEEDLELLKNKIDNDGLCYVLTDYFELFDFLKNDYPDEYERFKKTAQLLHEVDMDLNNILP